MKLTLNGSLLRLVAFDGSVCIIYLGEVGITSGGSRLPLMCRRMYKVFGPFLCILDKLSKGREDLGVCRA